MKKEETKIPSQKINEDADKRQIDLVVMRHYKVYLFPFYRKQDQQNFEKLLEKENVLWWEFREIPFPNVWGQLLTTQYTCIYLHTEELEMEVLC